MSQSSNYPITQLNLAAFTLQLDTTHHYRPRWSGYAAHCRVRLWRNDHGQHIVMFTELPDNKGMSITNYSENLASRIRQMFGLDVDTTYWIEHHPSSPARQRHADFTKQFDQITYTWDLLTYTADDPEWKRLDPAALQPLFAQPAPAQPTPARLILPTDVDWNRAQWIRLKAENPQLAAVLYEHVMAAWSKTAVEQELQRAGMEYLLQRQILCAYDHLKTSLEVDPPR